jgi:hypothetical protein
VRVSNENDDHEKDRQAGEHEDVPHADPLPAQRPSILATGRRSCASLPSSHPGGTAQHSLNIILPGLVGLPGPRGTIAEVAPRRHKTMSEEDGQAT